MKYKAKYLPVEGEINDGDFYKLADLLIYRVTIPSMIPDLIKLGAKKVKLFLISTDIKVGDKFTVLPNPFYIVPGEKTADSLWLKVVAENPMLPDFYYKVIGEISPEAIWVKEGDKFDKEQLGFGSDIAPTFTQPFMQILDFQPGIEMCKKRQWFIKVKCPTCGHFH